MINVIPRTNEEIIAREIRLIDEDGKQLGIVPVSEGLERARGKSLDLVEVASDAAPPVCRIMDYTKYVYDQKRKQKLAKKKTVRTDTKEVKFRPNIDQHDFEYKLKHIREFLEKGHKVKVTLRYRPREMRHYELGTDVIKRLAEKLGDIATVEMERQRHPDSRMQSVLLTRKRALGSHTAEHDEDEPERLATEEEST